MRCAGKGPMRFLGCFGKEGECMFQRRRVVMQVEMEGEMTAAVL
jgi:hypothetical protein